MINQHNGKRIGHHTGKETLPKYNFIINKKHSKSHKKYKCRICGNKYLGTTMVEDIPDKHGRVFYCVKCFSKK